MVAADDANSPSDNGVIVFPWMRWCEALMTNSLCQLRHPRSPQGPPSPQCRNANADRSVGMRQLREELLGGKINIAHEVCAKVFEQLCMTFMTDMPNAPNYVLARQNGEKTQTNHRISDQA